MSARLGSRAMGTTIVGTRTGLHYWTALFTRRRGSQNFQDLKIPKVDAPWDITTRATFRTTISWRQRSRPPIGGSLRYPLTALRTALLHSVLLRRDTLMNRYRS